MSIVSAKFLLFFILSIVIYYITPKKYQWISLLIVSLFFYSMENTKNLLFIIFTSTTVYYASQLLFRKDGEYKIKAKDLERQEKKALRLDRDKNKKTILTIALILNFAILIYFKFFTSFINLLSKVMENELEAHKLIMPIGISFYTFQATGYLIDVYRGTIEPASSYPKFLLFVSYFPQLTQGPISKYKELMPQLLEGHDFSYNNFILGLQRVLWGYFKKMVIADNLAMVVGNILSNTDLYYGIYIPLAILIYSIQIYADFSGGIDIIMGFSKIMDINLTENFTRPFFAKSLSEFWQRWHISLGTWMRDYVFYPIAFSKRFKKLTNRLREANNKKLAKLLPSSMASMVVFLIVGLWHGSNVKYIAFGLYNGIIITSSTLLEDNYRSLTDRLKINTQVFSWKFFQIIRTFFITIIGRYFTKADSLSHALELFKLTFQEWNPWVLFDGSIFNLGLNAKEFFIVFLAIASLIVVGILQERKVDVGLSLTKQNIYFKFLIYWLLIMSIIIFGNYGSHLDTSNFIYQGF